MMVGRPDEEGIDRPIGFPGWGETSSPEEPEYTSPPPAPNKDGVIAPGPTPESR
jgi:hypothetical protein